MTAFAILWIVLAVFAANLPFVSRRFLAFWPLKQIKSISLCLFEMCFLYFSVGLIGFLFEQRLGQLAPQRWEFYAITAVLFLTLAFPGFVFRFLLKRRD